jgi:hypothetical protein
MGQAAGAIHTSLIADFGAATHTLQKETACLR